MAYPPSGTRRQAQRRAREAETIYTRAERKIEGGPETSFGPQRATCGFLAAVPARAAKSPAAKLLSWRGRDSSADQSPCDRSDLQEKEVAARRGRTDANSEVLHLQQLR